MELFRFNNGNGHIMIEEEWITMFFSDQPRASKKFPTYRIQEHNCDIIDDVLRLSNMAGYYLSEEDYKRLLDYKQKLKEEQ